MGLPSIRAGLDTLRANPLRTLLSTLGVIMGAASLVAVLSLGDGAESFARQRILQEGYNHVVIEPITFDAVDGQRIARTSVAVIGPADADAIASIVGTRAKGGLLAQGATLWTRGSGGAASATGVASSASLDAPPNARPDTPSNAPLTAPTDAPSKGTPGAAPQAGARGVRVLGLSPIGQELPSTAPIVAGRALTAAEARSGEAVCVVSRGLAAIVVSGGVSTASATSGTPATGAGNGGGGDVSAAASRPAADVTGALGASISVAGRDWRIVGVQEDLLGDRGFVAVVPFAQADQVLREPTRRIVLESVRVEDVPSLTADVQGWADARAGWRGGVRVSAPGQRRLEEIGRGILLFKMLMGAFTAIALIVGGIGIMNVLLASVVERTREIGIRKAVGARRRDIVTQFLTESVAIAAAGSLLGLAIGLGGAFGLTAVMRARTAMLIFAGFSWGTLAASAGAAVIVGLVFGTYPALRAARLSPIDAITRE